MKFWVYYPPSANRLYRAVPNRGVLKSAEYRQYLLENTWLIKTQKDKGQPIKGAYEIHYSIQRPDKRKRDIDNLLKPLNDLIVDAGCVEDDSLCQKITAEWIGTGNAITVTITEFTSLSDSSGS